MRACARAALLAALTILMLGASPQQALAIAPANDDIADAEVIGTDSATLWFDLADATVEPEEAVDGYARTVWYSWTPSYTGIARASINQSQDTRVAWFTGPSATHNLLTELTPSLDLSTSNTLYEHRNVTAGTTYWIVVRDDGTTYPDRTRLQLNPVVAADDFADAAYLAPPRLDTSGNAEGVATWTGGATRETNEPNHAGAVGNSTVWVRVYAASTEVINIDTQDSDFDTALAVYTGDDVASLTQIAANDDVAAGVTFSRVQISAVAGRTYHVAVSGKASTVGTANIRAAGRAEADDFASPVDLTWTGAPGYNDYESLGPAAATLEAGEPVHAVGHGNSSWYRLVPDQNTRIGIQHESFGAPGSLHVYSGASLGALTRLVTGVDNPAGVDGFSEFDATAGTTYWVVPTGAQSRSGEDFVFRIYNRQTNDDFASPTVIDPPTDSATWYYGYTFGATREAGEPTHAVAGTHSVWFSWTPTVTQNVSLTTYGTWVDSMLAVYTGTSLGTLTPVGSDDDGNGLGGRVQFTAVAGTTYRIAVDSKGSVGGWEWLRVDPLVAPANDMFANAEALPAAGSSVVRGTWGATLETGEPRHGTVAGGSSLWWSWTAPTTRLVAIDTLASASTTQLAVYTGSSMSTLNLVGRSEDWNGSGRGRVEFLATAGMTYRIAIDVARGDDGEVTLSVEPPPVNDKFGGATTLGVAGRTQMSTLGGSRQPGEPSHAGDAGGSSIWYSWTAPANATVAISTQGSDFDTVLGVYTGNAVDTLVGVAANDDAIGTASRVTFSAVAGATYRIAIDGKADTRGRAVLRWNPVSHDQFASAQSITGTSVTTSAELAGTGTEIGEPVHAPGVDGTAWYTWTAPVTGTVGISSSGSAGDTVLAAYTGASLGTLTQVQASDNHGGTLHARLRFTATAGTVYRIALATHDATGGIAWLRLNETPTNDAFASATALSGAQPRATGHNFGSTSEAGEPAHAGFASSRTVWWTWTAPASTPVTVDTVGSEFDTLLGVYTGTAVGSLTTIASSDDGAGVAPQSRTSFAATAGVTYHFAVAGKSSEVGEIVLSVDAPANDHFASATAITPGSTVTSTTAGTSLELFEPNVRSGSHSAWFRWSPGVSDTVEVRLSTTATDAALHVYTGTSVSTLQPTRAMRVAGSNVRAQIDGTAGSTYWIQVVDRTGTSYTLNMPAPPANDHLSGATVLSGFPASVTGSTVGATYDRVISSREYVDPFGGETDLWAVDGEYSGTWYSWTATATQQVRFSTTSGAQFGIYVGSDEDDLRLFGAENGTGYWLSSGARTVDVVAGITYHLLVGSDQYRETSSSVTVSVGSPTTTSISWDAFASPHTLSNPSDWDSEANFGLYTCESGEPSHGGQPCEGTIWYSWTPTTSGTGTISTVSSTVSDTMVAVYTGTSLGSLTPVASNDDVTATNKRSLVEWAVTAGVEYRIAVGRRNGATGYLRVTSGIMIANDKIANPATIGTDSAVIAAQTRSTSEDPEDTRDHSAWYAWTPGYTGVAQANLANHALYNYLTAHDGAPGSLTALPTVQAPAVPSNTYTYGTGESGLAVTAGTPVRLRLYASFSRWDSALDLRLNQSSVNEAYASAWTMDPASTRTVSDFLAQGSLESGEPLHASAAPNASLWYSFTPTVTRTYRLDTHLSTPALDTVLAVYTGTAVNALTPVASANDTLGTTKEHLTFTGVAGTTYSIAVARRNTAIGFATLRLDAPDNDLMVAATPITGGSATIDDTIANGYHQDEDHDFDGTSQATVWYQWTAPNTGPAFIDTMTETAFDTQLAVYEGPDPATATQVAYNDDYGGTRQSRVDFTGTAGTTYWILVGSWGSYYGSYYIYDGISAGEGDFRLRVRQAPGNDDFVDATTISGWSGTATADTTLATIESGEPLHASTPGGRSIWFYWTAPASGPVVIDTFGSVADTLLGVYTGSDVTTLTEVASNDDWSTSQSSLVSFTATSGTTYRIAVDSFRALGNSITLTVNARPPNDDFVNAISVSGTAAEAAGYNTNGTAEAGEPAHAGAAASDSIWYTWIAPASGTTVVDTLGSDIDTRLAVYTGGAVGSLTLVAQNDDAASTVQSRLSFVATAGVTYRIAIDGKLGANGDVLLRVNAAPPSIPLLEAPAEGANTTSLTPGLQARFQHSDVGAVGRIEFEVCRDAMAPADPWSTNCASGYQVFSTGMSLSHGSVGTGYPVTPLAQAQQYAWRAREFDGSAWSGWTGSRTFTAQASVSIQMSTLGRTDLTRSTGPWTIDFGVVSAGSITDIGPAGSGQTTSGSAIDYAVTSDGTTTTTAQGTDFTDGVAATLPIAQLARRDRASGETVEQLAWTPFDTTSQIVEQDVAGTTTHSWDLQLTVPAAQPAGSYTGSVLFTTVASP